MRSKPRSRKYRNLVAHGAVIYYDRTVSGRRFCFSTRTDSWDEAAAVRDLFEQRKGIGLGFAPAPEAPRFEGFAARYLSEATAHLAESTRDDRRWMLRLESPLVRYFGSMRLDAIRRSTLLEWYTIEMEGRARSWATVNNYLNALSGVLGYALDLELIESNPVTVLREILRRRRRTKQGRAEAASRSLANPIEPPERLAALVTASAQLEADGHLATMLMVDAGLRLGEAEALAWPDVWFGRAADDPARALVIQASTARGKYKGATKSGRSRRVALSARLWRLLRERWEAKGRPQTRAPILRDFKRRPYRRDHFDVACKAAGLVGHRPKDLRDTFGSYLLTAGIPLAYVSLQLGHAQQATTERHYARWVVGDGYRAPLVLAEHDVVSDAVALLAAQAQRTHNGTVSTLAPAGRDT